MTNSLNKNEIFAPFNSFVQAYKYKQEVIN
jgi:hypothetical protein